MRNTFRWLVMCGSALFTAGCLTITGNCIGATYGGNWDNHEGNFANDTATGPDASMVNKACSVTSTVNIISVALSSPTARATIRNARGEEVGKALLSQTNDGVLVVANVYRLPARRYALHVHAVGKCEPPEFQSAGPHLDPTGKAAEGQHLGDLIDFEVGPGGAASAVATLKGATLDGGPNGLLGPQGTAVVVQEKAAADTAHATATGPRVACGVVTTEGN